MDTLYNTRREQIQQISVEHTRRLLGGRIGIVFYDVTTLYFETAREDILRSPGFSKDGKTAESQIVLGLLVSRDGYPLSYNIFNGGQYEGRTMRPSSTATSASLSATPTNVPPKTATTATKAYSGCAKPILPAK